MEEPRQTKSTQVSTHKGIVFVVSSWKDIASVHTLVFKSPYSQLCRNGFNTEDVLYILQWVLSPFAEAETIEGLFDVLIAL